MRRRLGCLIATLADNAMAYNCKQLIGWASWLATISLSVDFVGTAEIGQMAYGGKRAHQDWQHDLFAHSLIKANDVIIARANATFRVMHIRDRTHTVGTGD